VNETRLKLISNSAPWHPAKKRHQLAAVADSKTEGIGAVVEGLKLVPELFIEADGCSPAFCRIKDIGVAETANKDHATEIIKRNAVFKKVSYGDVPGLESREIECRNHLPVAVASLFTNDRDFWLGCAAKTVIGCQ
jgi:hypothetical protein